VIEAERLTMHYGPVVAVAEASFVVRPQEVVGLLGPNGAGKSTIMRILTTYLWPTSGTARVAGHDVRTAPLEVRRKIGYLPEVLPLYVDMTVGAYLSFVGRARGLSGASLKTRRDWVVERCGLGWYYQSRIRELSKGFRQRTTLAQALIHDPEVVILDEPTSGLDPHQILEVRRLVRELARTKTVIFSTHILQEVEAVADRVVIINRGRIVADGTIAELRRKVMPRARLELVVAAPREEVEPALAGLAGAAGARKVEFLGARAGRARFRIEAEPGTDAARELGALALARRWPLAELVEKPFTLEETFLALTSAEAPEGAAEAAAEAAPAVPAGN
jgi:ABC-2 type transport system ATP-binding protein